MPRKLLVLVFFVLAALAALGPLQSALAAQDPHGGAGKIVLDELEIAQRQRARSIFNEIVCRCPSENWSKSLLNCPDGCADPQKQEILHRILEGWTDAQIVAEQVQKYGPRAHGKPDDLLTYLLPVLVLVGSVLTVGVVFLRWKRAAAAGHASRRPETPPDESELAAVERELKELR